MYDDVMATDIDIVSITSTTTAQPIGKLIADAYAAKTPAVVWPVLPRREVRKIIITPSADVTIQDTRNTTPDQITIASGAAKTFDVLNAQDKLMIKNAATVKVEIYYGR